MKTNPVFTFHIPTKLFFGCGELDRLATEQLPGKKALIVVSAGTAMKKYGYLELVEKKLRGQCTEYIVFDKVTANPRRKEVMEASALAREEKCDFVIGLGGGSSIDAAKAAAMMAVNEGDLWDYAGGGSGKGIKPAGALPVVAIPTTSGTGTEVDHAAVITNEEKQEKIGLHFECLFPVMAIVDPRLMVSLPPHLTAFQGFDAFFHAAEGFLSKRADPVSDLFALEAVRLLYKYLPVAVMNGRDLKARTKVAWAATLGGMVLATSGCASLHGMEHAMSAKYPKLPHGTGLIALSKEYFDIFRNDKVKRLMKMADAMNEAPSARPFDFIIALDRMMTQCGVADIRLSKYGIKEEDLEGFVREAQHTSRSFEVDPRRLSDEEILEIYKKSYK